MYLHKGAISTVSVGGCEWCVCNKNDSNEVWECQARASATISFVNGWPNYLPEITKCVHTLYQLMYSCFWQQSRHCTTQSECLFFLIERHWFDVVHVSQWMRITVVQPIMHLTCNSIIQYLIPPWCLNNFGVSMMWVKANWESLGSF